MRKLIILILLLAMTVTASADIEGDWQYVIDGKSAVLIRYIGKDAAVEIPETIEGMPVARIAGYAFMDSAGVDVFLPAVTIEIDEDAFTGLCGTLWIPGGHPDFKVVLAVVNKTSNEIVYNCTPGYDGRIRQFTEIGDYMYENEN